MKQDEQTTNLCGGFTNFVHKTLTSRNLPIWVALLAILLTLPSLKVGLLLDDYHHKLLISGSDSFAKFLNHPLDMFRFMTDPEQIRELMDFGILPWWTDPQIKGAFWRPIASLTHWLDYSLFPETTSLMHAQSILWFGALVAAVALLYRRLMGATLIAGLAALIFAIDDAHGTPVGFLANRNAILATLFGVLTLLAHDKWRRDNWRPGTIAAPLLLILSLLSAEAGISTCAFLAAYAFFLDEGTILQRCKSLIPYAIVVIIWRITWTKLGYGIANTGMYVDPLTNPLRFLHALKIRSPILLLGQLGFPPSDTYLMLFPHQRRFLWKIAIIFLATFIVLLWPLLRRDKVVRFWLAAVLLSVIPICATVPCDRLLTFTSIAAAGLLAQFLNLTFTQNTPRPKNILWRTVAVTLSLLLILIHFVIAPLLLSLRARYPMGPPAFSEKMVINTPLDSAVKDQDLIVINPPVTLLALYSTIIWETNGQPVPRHTRILTSSNNQPVTVYRPDENTLFVRPTWGYMAWFPDRLFRTKKHALALGEKVKLTGMTVEITKLTKDGRPKEAAFKFDVPLEDASLRWLKFKDGDFIPFTPPPIGQTVKLTTKNPFEK